MADSYHSSSSSLCDVDILRARLEEKENILQTAAQYGKDLLDQNRELSQNLDDTNQNYTRQIEVSVVGFLLIDNFGVTVHVY